MSEEITPSVRVRIVKILGVIFLAYTIIIPLVLLILPASELAQTTMPTLNSQVFLFMMPFELLLVYVFYRVLSKKIEAKNITGTAMILYIVSVNPSFLSLLIGFTDSFSENFGILMGLIFSLSGLLLSWVLISRHFEVDESPNY